LRENRDQNFDRGGAPIYSKNVATHSIDAGDFLFWRVPVRAATPILGSLETDTTKAHADGWHCPLTLAESLSRAMSF
jgi:hypothetical protein